MDINDVDEVIKEVLGDLSFYITTAGFGIYNTYNPSKSSTIILSSSVPIHGCYITEVTNSIFGPQIKITCWDRDYDYDIHFEVYPSSFVFNYVEHVYSVCEVECNLEGGEVSCWVVGYPKTTKVATHCVDMYSCVDKIIPFIEDSINKLKTLSLERKKQIIKWLGEVKNMLSSKDAFREALVRSLALFPLIKLYP